MTEVTKDWRGSFAIPMTPFDDCDGVDEDTLAAEIEFCIESGVGGLVVPVMVSEFRVLSEEERRILIRVPVEVSNGRVPIVANVAAVNTPLAMEFARYAQKTGADAVIAMPPYTLRPDAETVYAYYQAINDVVDIPIWIQNAGVVAQSPDRIVTTPAVSGSIAALARWNRARQLAKIISGRFCTSIRSVAVGSPGCGLAFPP